MCIDAKKKEQMVRIGERVKAERIKKGLMPQGLCKRAGLPSVGALEALEAGKYLPCKSRLNAIAAVLCVDISELIGEESQGQEVSAAETPAAMRPPENTETAGKGKSYLLNAEKLKTLRAREKVSQREVGALLGVSRSLVQQWECNTRKILVPHIKLLSKYFDVPAQELIKGEWKDTDINMALDDTKEAIPVRPVSAMDDKAHALQSPEAPAQAARQEPLAENIPEDPEKVFCRNVLFYMEEKYIPEEDFMAAVGTDLEIFRKTAETGGRLELGVMLRAAKLFGKSIEKVIFDNCHEAALLKEREELMARTAQIRKILGR